MVEMYPSSGARTRSSASAKEPRDHYSENKKAPETRSAGITVALIYY
jgi:hypothetical protein